MTDEERARLEAAERVCLLFGWSPAHGHGGGPDIEKATGQAWQEWAEIVGSDFTGPEAHPDLGEEAIKALARKRDGIREETLKRLPVEVVQ